MKLIPSGFSKKTLFLVCFYLLMVSAFSQSYTVETVPNVKLQTNSYVSNPDGLLSKSAVNQIDQELNPHYAIEMHLHNLTNENQTLTLKNIFPIG